MSQGNSKKYIIYDSINDIYHEVFSLAKFCREKNLNESCLRDVAKGRQLFQHRGFYCVEKSENAEEILKLKFNTKSLIDITVKFNKLPKPVNKKKRYNQTDQYVDFLNNTKKYYLDLHVNQKKSCMSIGADLGVDAECVRLQFLKNNLDRLNYVDNSSKEEAEVRKFLKDITGEEFLADRNIISPLEIDCYSDKFKIGFEYCGLYWHSEVTKKRNYHYFKYKNALDKNIKLIHIFEHEWKNRNLQVKNFIKAQLGIFDKRIYGRNCTFIEIPPDYEFFENYHIQGAPGNIKYCFGLFHNGEQIGAVSYAPHHRNNELLSLNRLSFKNNIQVIGGASKLIKNSLQHLSESDIVTWSDNRWSNGKIYRDTGFVFDGDLYADYFYYNKKSKQIKSKQSMKKSNLDLKPNETEHEFALRNDWLRVFDCGKKRWKLTKGK